MKRKVCYVLPLYNLETSSHFYHIYELLEDIAKKIDIFLFVEHSEQCPKFKNITQIYIQRFKHFPLNLAERFVIFLSARLKGYNKFYIHISHFSAMIASVITKLLKGETYLWRCGLGADLPLKRDFRGIKARILYRYMLSLAFKLVDHLVTGTESMARYYSKRFNVNQKKIDIMPQWVNTKRFDPKKFDKGKMKKMANIKDNKKVILFIHELSERKGVQYLIEIVKEVVKDISNVIFLVVGNGLYKWRLRCEIEDNNLEKIVIVIGEVPNREIVRYYAIADVFIMPSEEEGFPRVLLEAMTMNVPFVATDVGGVKDILPRNGKYFIVEKGNIQEFASRVIELLKDNSEYDFRSYVERKYEKKIVAKRFIETLFPEV